MTLLPLEEARVSIGLALRERRAEIEQAALARAHSISDVAETADPAYVEGLRQAVSAALEYGIAAIELGEEESPPPPTILLSQARLAACSGVSLDTVLRRYFAGFTLFGDYLLRAAQEAEPAGTSLQRLLQTQATQFDRLIAAVSEEYTCARESRFRSPEQRLAERIKRMLAGEPIDTAELDYDFEGWHIALIATGPGAANAMREFAAGIDRRLLLIRPEECTAWAWLGGRARMTAESIERLLSGEEAPEVTLSIGEPVAGIGGWRLTHRQAKVALPVALRGGKQVVRYADVALLASILRDDLLATSLRRLYIDPLEDGQDDGAASRRTLRAYFEAGHNISAAAATLGLNRRTVSNRLREVEERLGCSLTVNAADVEIALRLDDHGSSLRGPGSHAAD